MNHREINRFCRALLPALIVLSPLLNIPARGQGNPDPSAPVSNSANTPSVTHAVDGIIGAGEYQSGAAFSGGEFELFYTITGEKAMFGIRAATTGWVSIGFDPEDRMFRSDVILAWVDDNGIAVVDDDFSTGPMGPHPNDTELGGTDDVFVYAGTESDGKTTIEFERALVTGDEYDKEIQADSDTKIMWGYGPSDTPTIIHSKRGMGTISPPPADSEPGITTDPVMIEQVPSREVKVRIWAVHAVMMGVGFILALVGIIYAFRRKAIKGWLKTHRMAGYIVAIIIGISYLLVMSAAMTAGHHHFTSTHKILGLATVIIAIGTTFVGRTALKRTGQQSKSFRRIHRIIGWITGVLLVVSVITGLMQARLI